MSRKWREVDSQIQIGLIQELMMRLLKRYPEYRINKHSSMNIDLYHNFLRGVHVAVEKTEADPLLSQLFAKLNNDFFFNSMEAPNLRWGQESFRKLGSYDFGTDTITISTALHPDRTNDPALLDYVLYHEMLHKKHKFKSTGKRTQSHSKAFRDEEAKFPDADACEHRLRYLSRPSMMRSWSGMTSQPSRQKKVPSTKQDENPFKRLISRIWE